MILVYQKRTTKSTRFFPGGEKCQGEYVTRCCLGQQIVIMDGLKEVLQQQRAIGNNLNRLTVLANMGRITTVDMERTAQELADIGATLRSIQEQGRRGR